MNKSLFFQAIKRQLCKGFVATAAMLAVVACSNEETVLEMPAAPVQGEQLPAGWVSARGRMDLTVTSYDGDAVQTRAGETETWAEGDKIYFIIESGQTKIPVVAVYSKVFSAWSFNYNASATIPASGTMKGCYLEGATSSDYSGATLGEEGIVYIDSKASYTYQNEEFAITVNLKPSYVRMRFAGTQGQEVEFSGLSRVVSFDATTYTFEQESVVTWLTSSTTAENEKYYTPYVYGYLNADNKIYIATDGNSFGRTISAGTLSAGESAWMTMPSGNYIPKGWSAQESPYNLRGKIQWNSSATEEQKNVILALVGNMVRVAGGTFISSTWTTEILDDYYVNRYEVTQKEWSTIMGETLNWGTGYGLGDNVAAYNVSWSKCEDFISKLNELSGLSFRFPTGAEWEFAARGGNKSKGYTYSGSNTIGDVAWYSGNSSYVVHQVGEKIANELGLYDMSGNLSEFSSEEGSSNYYYLYGGDYSRNASYCTITSRYNYYYTNTDTEFGLRLFHDK